MEPKQGGTFSSSSQTQYRNDLYNIFVPSGSKARAEEAAPRIVHHPSDVVVKVGSPATLSCRADGNPKPAIEWLRYGQPLETKADGQLQPMVLSEGSLFFLSVGGGKRGQSHEGIYACVARNSAGKAASRNASLYIAGKTVARERIYYLLPYCITDQG